MSDELTAGDTPVPSLQNPRVTVGGDAKGGWLVDIHDGTNQAAYSPEADNADEACHEAMHAHGRQFFPETQPPAAPSQPAHGDGNADNAPPPETQPPAPTDSGQAETDGPIAEGATQQPAVE